VQNIPLIPFPTERWGKQQSFKKADFLTIVAFEGG
jgi:hypothetical protein